MKHLFLLLLLVTSFSAFALEVAFYNAHNLFDTTHDEGKNDWEFLPASAAGKKAGCETITNSRYKKLCLESDWNEEKLQVKIKQLSFAIKNNFEQLPDILGLCEVENLNVVSKLAKELGYEKVLVSNSPDQRGIDVAVLINETSDLKLITSNEHEVKGAWFKNKPTRNILEAELDYKGESLTVFVNHWPSQGNPSEARIAAAKELKKVIFKRKFLTTKKHFLAMGDFNTIPQDYPHPFREVLEKGINKLTDVQELYRAGKVRNLFPLGTYFYPTEMTWNRLDTFFVSESLLDKQGIDVRVDSFDIKTKGLTRDFEFNRNNEHHAGSIVRGIPNKSNHNATEPMSAGYSDHFPISIKLN